MAFIIDERSINENKRFSRWAIVLSSIVFVLITLDIVGDYRDGVTAVPQFTEKVGLRSLCWITIG